MKRVAFEEIINYGNLGFKDVVIGTENLPICHHISTWWIMLILLWDKISYSGDNLWDTLSICVSSLICHQILKGETKNISKKMCCFCGFIHYENTDLLFSFPLNSCLIILPFLFYVSHHMCVYFSLSKNTVQILTITKWMYQRGWLAIVYFWYIS